MFAHTFSVDGWTVFATIEKEIDAGGLSSLIPIDQTEGSEEADADASRDVVLKRSGRILGPGTLLKSDLFLGLQKLSLPERIEGAPNFRVANLALSQPPRTPVDGRRRAGSISARSSSTFDDGDSAVYGVGMPSVTGCVSHSYTFCCVSYSLPHSARSALQRMSAGPNGDRTIVWTSLREEPVIYVNNKPYVLRLQDEPMENVIMTGETRSLVSVLADHDTAGVSAEAVESQERKLKKELLRGVCRFDHFAAIIPMKLPSQRQSRMAARSCCTMRLSNMAVLTLLRTGRPSRPTAS